MSLRDQLIKHEGLKSFPYRDTVGKLTVGVGRNLDDVGVSQAEAMFMLDNDIDKATQAVLHAWPWMLTIGNVRTEAVTNMAFNMGIGRLRGFTKMLEAMQAHNFELAAKEMLDSKWAVQVGSRSKELAQQMITGAYA